MPSSTSYTSASASKNFNIALWVAQGLLFVAFGMSGLMKLVTPADQLGQMLPLPTGLLRFIGTAEVLGTLGIILPALTGVMPRLTPLAALGLLTIMVLASAYHISRGEFTALPVTIGLGALAAFVAWGRRFAAPVAERASV